MVAWRSAGQDPTYTDSIPYQSVFWSPSCSTSDPSVCWMPRRVAEDGPKTLAPVNYVAYQDGVSDSCLWPGSDLMNQQMGNISLSRTIGLSNKYVQKQVLFRTREKV